MTTAPLRIGIFGGAFDPPHLGHVALARAALDSLALDQLLIMPTGHAWHKSTGLSPAEHRAAMARLAFAGLSRITVDLRETLRSGPTYTIDSLLELTHEHPGAQLVLLMGTDQARALSTWHRWQDILKFATICVAVRGEISPTDESLAQFQQLSMAPLAVGSTQVRKLVAARRPIDKLVPAPVARYIAHHHLYLNA